MNEESSYDPQGLYLMPDDSVMAV